MRSAEPELSCAPREKGPFTEEMARRRGKRWWSCRTSGWKSFGFPQRGLQTVGPEWERTWETTNHLLLWCHGFCTWLRSWQNIPLAPALAGIESFYPPWKWTYLPHQATTSWKNLSLETPMAKFPYKCFNCRLSIKICYANPPMGSYPALAGLTVGLPASS